MAFDQNTRNRLQRFVTDARRALEEEFTRQLQNDYGLDPVSGTTSPLESLRHINDQQRETARILRDTLAHYCASSDTDTQAGLDRIVREQAFTVLNRLAALRMAEARGLLIESVGNGYQAKGFQLYTRLAGTGLGETGDAYRVYLQSVFDEFALDLPGLFDRFSPQGRLFPREAALLQVLALINHGEIELLWAEDETIGWIYQYFNSKEERKAMRDASQAPRNSRELAVRNQFFTPRYVVEFLVDNTLGRLWFNWTGGQTALRDRCQYLLVKPDEQPEASKRLRDPRTIKLLDPACGSMHFGLYAFDLFQEIYREAWEWEQMHGPGALDRETGGSPDLKPLSETYADQDAFLHDAPRLVIEHNIYGVDIDPRATQIASLALWLRAQRAWHEAGVKAKDRPQVGQGHVVAAVAPPAEVDLRKRFMEELDPLDAELFEQTLFMLKGLPELGVLLQVEKELPALIRKVFGEHGPMFSKEDMAQWQKAETRLREALTDYAHAARSTYQGRLFAEDALQGLRMIDHCREVFDVVVMNPPFGSPTQSTKPYIKTAYPAYGTDVFPYFVGRGVELLRDGGRFGAITNRTAFFAVSQETWREEVLLETSRLETLIDLGYGVLDALVETAAYTISKDSRTTATNFKSATSLQNKETAVSEWASHIRFGIPASNPMPLELFRNVPSFRFAFWLPEDVIRSFSRFPRYLDHGGVQVGLQTSHNFRFLRLAWEVIGSDIALTRDEANDRKWAFYAKGGEYAVYYSDIHLVLNWKNAGYEVKNFTDEKGNIISYPRNESQYFLPGLTYSSRTTSNISVRVLPQGVCFDTKGPRISSEDRNRDLADMAIFMSRTAAYMLDFMTGSADVVFSGSAARDYTSRSVSELPMPSLNDDKLTMLKEIGRDVWLLASRNAAHSETDRSFLVPAPLVETHKSLVDALSAAKSREFERYLGILNKSHESELITEIGYCLDDDAKRSVRAAFGVHPNEYPARDLSPEDLVFALEKAKAPSAERSTGTTEARRELTKKSYFAHRDLEIVAHILEAHPNSVMSAEGALEVIDPDWDRRQVLSIFSYFVGVAFGRWKPFRHEESTSEMRSDPFSPLPRLQPGINESSAAELLVDDPAHSDDIIGMIEKVIDENGVGGHDDVDSFICAKIGAKSFRAYLRQNHFGHTSGLQPQWFLLRPSISL